MYISRLVIRGFRNFHLLDVPLRNGATCIVGENNTGKSNLVHAIRLVLDANMSSYHRRLTPDDFPAGVDLRIPQQVLISVEFSDFANKYNEEAMVGDWLVEDDLARLSYRFRPNPDVRKEIAAGKRPPENLTIDDYHWDIRGGSGGIDPIAVEWNQDFGASLRFEELQQSFSVVLMKPLRDVEQELRQSRGSPLGRLLDATDIPKDEQERLIGILADANDQISGSGTVAALGAEISGAFDETAGTAFKMGVKVGMASPSFTDVSRGLTVLLSNDAMKDFDPARNGLGLNNVLYISMLLRVFERRMQSDKTAGQLLLVEEPEAHLHPQLQRVLYSTLSSKSFQTIATTHSTHITSQVPLESVVVLTNDGTAATASTVPTASGNLTENEIRDLERYLDATRAALLFARKVMLVEGPAEVFLIPVLVKEVLGINLDDLGITVVPIYGVHFDVYAKLFGPNAITKKCAIVADGDLAPSDASESDGPDILPALVKPNLRALENAFVRVFACRTTLEREVTGPTTFRVFADAARELGAEAVADELLAANSRFPIGITLTEDDMRYAQKMRDIVLKVAKRFGKARFAQVASKYVPGAGWIPDYLRDAVNWLIAQ